MDEIRASNRGRLKFGGVVSEASRFTSLKLRKPRRVAHLVAQTLFARSLVGANENFEDCSGKKY